MSCLTGISKSIVSDCTTSKSGGLEVIAYVFNRLDHEVTYDVTDENLITDITNDTAKVAYKITGIKSLLNAGHDIVVTENRPDKYTHYFNFQQFEILAEDIRNVDDINDVFIVVESKDKNSTGEGVFIAYGVKKGLWKSTDTQRANDINGARNVELTSLAGQEEPYSRYVVLDTDYATTKALLETLVSTPGA